MILLPFASLLEARRTRRDRKAAHLAGHPLFARLTARQLRIATACVDIMGLPAGKVLARQGAFPVETFVISRGWARVLLDGVTVSTVDRHQTVGIAARFCGVPFGTTLVAATEMELYVVQPRCLRTFVEVLPDAIAEPWSDFSPRALAPVPTAA